MVTNYQDVRRLGGQKQAGDLHNPRKRKQTILVPSGPGKISEASQPKAKTYGMPEPLLRAMAKPSSLRFYQHFLQGEIGEEKRLPYWVLPHLVLDGRWDAAARYFDSFSLAGKNRKGMVLEQSLILLEKRFKYAERWHAVKSEAGVYSKFVESFDKLRGMLLGELERLDGYKIRTKWILDEIGRRFGD